MSWIHLAPFNIELQITSYYLIQIVHPTLRGCNSQPPGEQTEAWTREAPCLRAEWVQLGPGLAGN